MGYVDHNIPDFSSQPVRSAVLYSFDGGVNHSADAALIEDSQLTRADNMILENGIVKSRKALDNINGRLNITGNINGYCGFYECSVIHAGVKIYTVRGNTVTLKGEGLPDKKSVMVEFAGKMYIYCDTEIFSITREGVFEKEMPFAPLYKHNCATTNRYSYSLVKDFKPNVFAPAVSATYSSSNSQIYKYPLDFDNRKIFRIYLKGELLTRNTDYTADSEGFSLCEGTVRGEEDELKISYYSTDFDDEDFEKLSGCTVGCAFGGGTLEGTRVILSGNPDYPGEFYQSELGDGLTFYEGIAGTIGGGNENITAFSKQYGYLLVFTENTVSRMSYNYTEELGGYYTVKLINSSVGCVNRNAVGIVDNRNVFVSKDGIYIVDETENFDFQNIIPISRNIAGEEKLRGFFSLTDEDIKNSCVSIFGRRYYVLAGSKIFVWDFGNVPYASSADIDKAAKRLVWWEFSEIDADEAVASEGGLFFIRKVGLNVTVSTFGKGREYSKGEYRMKSKSLDFSYPHLFKTVKRMRFECRCDMISRVDMVFFADGKEFFSKECEITPGYGGSYTVDIKLPPVTLKRFDFEISGKGTGVGIFNMRIDYTVTKDNLKK